MTLEVFVCMRCQMGREEALNKAYPVPITVTIDSRDDVAIAVPHMTACKQADPATRVGVRPTETVHYMILEPWGRSVREAVFS